jgi:hypothetical protein
MGLLEKAIGGKSSTDTSTRSSLFARAIAASREGGGFGRLAEAEPTPSSFEIRRVVELKDRIAQIPSSFDSILAAWAILSEVQPLAALSFFIPRGEFITLAACSGFPSGTDDNVPMSLVPDPKLAGEPLGNDAKALFAPILGVPIGMVLRATSIWSDSSLVGLWIYHDDGLESAAAESREMLGSLLAFSGSTFPPIDLVPMSREPARKIAVAARKYHSALIFRFDIPDYDSKGEVLRGVKPETIRSIFLAACGKVISQSGVALAYGERSVACALGSSSVVDPELALFQFAKTLKRVLPFLSAVGFPNGKAIGFEPSSEQAIEDLSSFLFE